MGIWDSCFIDFGCLFVCLGGSGMGGMGFSVLLSSGVSC